MPYLGGNYSLMQTLTSSKMINMIRAKLGGKCRFSFEILETSPDLKIAITALFFQENNRPYPLVPLAWRWYFMHNFCEKPLI